MSDGSPQEMKRPPGLERMFDRVANCYDARPGYPERVFDVLAARCGMGPSTCVLEIGPGTGQATLPLLDRGASITAVEPGTALAARLLERTEGRPVEVVVADFLDAPLSDRSFDVVAAATSFHWIETRPGLQRCARVLRDGGWVALWWTIWGDPDEDDPFHQALVPILQAKAPHLVAEGTRARAYLIDVEVRGRTIAELAEFEDFGEETVRWEGRHDPHTIRAIFATFAGFIALPEPLRSELLDDIELVAQREFDGLVVRPYRTVIFTGRRRARAP